MIGKTNYLKEQYIKEQSICYNTPCFIARQGKTEDGSAFYPQ